LIHRIFLAAVKKGSQVLVDLAGHLSHEPLRLGMTAIMGDARTWSHAFLFSPYGAGSRRHLDERFSAPEVLKPIRSQLGVTHRVLDVLVAEPSL
jgi:hypothetical protein